MGSNEKIFKRVPIFGKININLEKESKIVYNCFNKDINRLRGIDHLGVLHYFLKIPKYSRYDYVMTMLYLIEKALQSNPSKLKGRLKLRNSNFTSSEEFLKCWALLYCIGHLQMTFTSEHAFLRYLIENDLTEEFLSIIKTQIDDFSLFSEESDENSENIKILLYEKIEKIVKDEKIMEFYKIFSLLKILNLMGCLDKYKPQISELAVISILKRNYLDFIEDVEKKVSLGKIIDYFEVIRMLSFTILDGYVSQEYLKVNPFVIVENLDKFMENNDYETLLKDINKFYSADIYKSPESAYYHHRARKTLSDDNIFGQYVLNELIEDIIKNKSDNDEIKLDKTIKNKIKTEQRKLDSKESPNKHFMENEISDNIRIKFDQILDPIKAEIEYIKPPVFGGIMFNTADNSYEIDMYPNSEIYGKSEDKIFDILKSVELFYEELKIPLALIDGSYELLLSVFDIRDNASILYHELTKPGNEQIVETPVIKDFLKNMKQYKNLLQTTPIKVIFDEMEENKLLNFLESFRFVGSYVISNVIPAKADHYSKLEVKTKIIQFPLLFKHSDLEKIIKILKEVNVNERSKKAEMDHGLIRLEKELDDVNSDAFYIFAPNTLFKKEEKELEIDYLLIKVLVSNKEILVEIGEVKSKPNNFDKDQCLNQLESLFGISKSSAKYLWETKEQNGTKLTISMDGMKTEDSKMLIFKKHKKNIS